MLRFDGAGTGDDLHRVPAERDAGRDGHERVLSAPFARYLLVRFGYVNDFGDAGERLHRLRGGSGGAAERPDRGALRAGQRHRRDAKLLDALDDGIDLVFRRIAFHDNEH